MQRDGICDRVRERDCWLGFEGAIRLQQSCLSGRAGGLVLLIPCAEGPTLRPGGRGSALSSRQRPRGQSQVWPRALAVWPVPLSLPWRPFPQLRCVPRAAPSGEKGGRPPRPPSPASCQPRCMSRLLSLCSVDRRISPRRQEQGAGGVRFPRLGSLLDSFWLGGLGELLHLSGSAFSSVKWAVVRAWLVKCIQSLL